MECVCSWVCECWIWVRVEFLCCDADICAKRCHEREGEGSKSESGELVSSGARSPPFRPVRRKTAHIFCFSAPSRPKQMKHRQISSTTKWMLKWDRCFCCWFIFFVRVVPVWVVLLSAMLVTTRHAHDDKLTSGNFLSHFQLARMFRTFYNSCRESLTSRQVGTVFVEWCDAMPANIYDWKTSFASESQPVKILCGREGLCHSPCGIYSLFSCCLGFVAAREKHKNKLHIFRHAAIGKLSAERANGSLRFYPLNVTFARIPPT